MDKLGQPKLLDLLSHEQIDLEMVPGGVRIATFTPDFRKVITMGQGGITIIELPSGRIENSFTARGSSGMHAIIIHPDGSELGAVTGRSVHRFSLPDLSPAGSDKHGAPNPTGAAYWDHGGVVVGGTDGLLHLEAGDGGPYATPLAQPLVDVLRDLGWNSPDDNFRNCWLQPPAEALESAARIAVLTTVTAFGYPEPPALP